MLHVNMQPHHLYLMFLPMATTILLFNNYTESKAQISKHGHKKQDPTENIPANEEHLPVAFSLGEGQLEVVMAFVLYKKFDFV